jgi:hypothetical protein
MIVSRIVKSAKGSAERLARHCLFSADNKKPPGTLEEFGQRRLHDTRPEDLVVMLRLLRRLLTPKRLADVRYRPTRLLSLRCGRWRWRGPARIARLWLRRPAALRSARLWSAMTTPISAAIASPVAVVATVSAAPVTPAALRRRAAISRAVVPIAGARAAVISVATANDHARLNNRSAIAVTGFVAWRVAGVGRGIGGIAAVSCVRGRAVRINGAACHQGGRGEHQTCNGEFHHERKGIP